MTSVLIFVPVAAALLALALPGHAARWLALLTSALATLAALAAWLAYDVGAGGLQFATSLPWIDALGVRYAVALDGLSLPFVFLTPLLVFVATLAEWSRNDRAFFSLFLLLQGAVTAVFSAQDLMLFFIAFELTLIPMFFVIGVWGYEGRRYASLKFLLYSLFGSVFLLAGILGVAFLASPDGVLTFDWRLLVDGARALPEGTALLLAAAFTVAFLVKLPAVPVHTWLPHAHTQAPTAGSILLAGVLLKMGGYGLVRFTLPLFPEAMLALQPLLAALAVIGILYGGYVALGQTDLKRLVAYSSVNHMGFALLGIASLTPLGVVGGVYQLVAHGVITGLLFLLVGMLSNRTHTRMIPAMRGMYVAMPALGGLLWFALLGGAGAPGLAGFLGEITSIVGAFGADRVVPFAVLAAFGILVNAALMLWTIQRVLQGEPTVQMRENYDLYDLRGVELLAAAPLVFLALLWGLWPPALAPYIDGAVAPLLETIHSTADALVNR